jgi:Na+/melibiose symporter-like transporter
VPHDKIVALGVLCGPGVALLVVIAVAFMSRYSLDRHRHAAIVATLEARRRAPLPAVEPALEPTRAIAEPPPLR